MNLRLVLLLAALAVTLGAVWWVERRGAEMADEALIEPVTRRAAEPDPVVSTSAPAPVVQSAGQGTVRFEALGPDLFPPHSWQPPPPPPPEPSPPPPPTAPPLPFQYLGRWEEAGEAVYFLAQGLQTLSLRQGDTVGPWRLDQAGPGRLDFTYVPLNEQRSLRINP